MSQIIIKVENVNMYIQGDLPKEIRDEIRETLSYVVPGFKHMPSYKNSKYKGLESWDGTKTIALYYIPRQTWLKAPTGLLSYIRKILDKHSVQYQLVDSRPQAIRMSGYSTEGLVLRDYQLPGVENALLKQRGLFKSATGSGKTEMVIKTIVEASVFPAIFYVTSSDLLEQAYSRFKKYIRFNENPVEIGRIGAGYCDIKPITICTVQSAQIALSGKYDKFDEESSLEEINFDDKQKEQIKDLVKQAQFIFVDECQHVSCSTIQSILNNSHKARFRIGGSASPWRDDGLDILIEACFGRYLCDISASFLIKRGYLIKPKITFNHFRQSLGATATYSAHYSSYIVENSARNEWIANRAKYHISQNRPTIILVKRIKHADLLAKMIPNCEILAASGNSQKKPKERKVLMDKMRRRELMCIIGTSLLDEGVDIPSASAGIFAGGGKSSTRALQRVGRFIRKDEAFLDKTESYIEEFFDHSKWLINHSKDRRKILETEPEFSINDNKETLSL